MKKPPTITLTGRQAAALVALALGAFGWGVKVEDSCPQEAPSGTPAGLREAGAGKDLPGLVRTRSHWGRGRP